MALSRAAKTFLLVAGLVLKFTSMFNCQESLSLSITDGAQTGALNFNPSSQMRSIQIAPGFNYTIICSRSNGGGGGGGGGFGGGTDRVWYRENVLVIDDTSQRVHVLLMNNKWNLVFNNFSLGDVGVYRCESSGEMLGLTISSGNPAVIASTPYLLVDGGAQENTLLTIQVFITGDPSPLFADIQWLFNGVEAQYFVLPDGDLILGDNLQNEMDTGNFTCIVNTTAGMASVNIFVQVVVPPSIEITSMIDVTSTASQIYLVDGSGNITCSESTGIPSPTFSWRLNGQPLVSGDGVDITVRSTSDLQVSTLLLTGITLASGGMYECVAQNSPNPTIYRGQSIDITVFYGPPPPSDIEATAVSSCMDDITWTLSDTSTNPNITASADRHIIEIQLETSQGNRTEWMILGENGLFSLLASTIPFLWPNTTYYIRGYGYNASLGRGENSATYGPFVSHQDDLLPSPGGVAAVAAGSNSISVTWSVLESECYVFANYTVRCEQEEGGLTFSATAPAGMEVGVVTRLSSNSIYICQVFGMLTEKRVTIFEGIVGRGGAVRSSEMIRTFTFPDAPLQPKEPLLSDSDEITFNSFTVTFEPLSNSQNISHYQILVLRLGDSDQVPQTHPDVLYITNSSFSTCRQVNDPSNKDTSFQPYVSTELAAMDFRTKVLIGGGAESVEGDRCNGKLVPGVSYTVFLRAFPMSFYDLEEFNGRVRRQVDNGQRQYVVFSSSNFLPSVTTEVDPRQEGGQVPSARTVMIIVIIVVIVGFIVVTTLVVVVVFLCYRQRQSKRGSYSPSVDSSSSMSSVNDVMRYPDTPDLGRRESGMEMKVMEAFSDPMDVPYQPSASIRREDFAEHVEKFDAKRQLLFQEEFEWIRKKSPWYPAEASNDPRNDYKNRYSNITAFDHSVVKLIPIEGVECSDYINANYISGYRRPQEYIATQGPLEGTVEDFWRMIWEKRTTTIIMLTNVVELGKIKCTQYWPNSNKVMYGQIAVTLENTHIFPDYTIRTFGVQSAMTNEMRRVLQFHYNKWPDYGTPKLAAPLLNFLKIVHESTDDADEDNGPMVVHCSAGVGRSGTVLTIDYCLQQLRHDNVVNISGFVCNMRGQRNYMVQTDQQYTFIHYAILEAVNYGDTSYEVGNFMTSYEAMQRERSSLSGASLLMKEFDRLGIIKTMVKKSSFQSRIKVKGAPQRHFHSSFHGGSMSGSLQLCLGHFLDGYNQSGMFLVMEGPDAVTSTRFWEMAWDHNCGHIVMLTPMDSEELFRYWPAPEEVELQFGSIKVMVESETAEHFYTARKIRLTNTKVEGISHNVVQYQFFGWTIEFLPRIPDFVSFVCDIMTKIDTGDKTSKIMVHDTASLGPAGIFTSMYYCIQRLQTEKMVDIFQAVQMVQLQRPGCVSSVEEYAFIYDSVNEFLMKNS